MKDSLEKDAIDVTQKDLELLNVRFLKMTDGSVTVNLGRETTLKSTSPNSDRFPIYDQKMHIQLELKSVEINSSGRVVLI